MRLTPLVPLGLSLVLLSASLTAAGDLTAGGLPRFLLLHFAAGLVYLLALVVVRRGADAGLPHRRVGWAVLGVAIAARVALLGAAPSLSTDCYRYLWEGRVQVAGFNPYAHAPDDPALGSLRDADWERVNHPEVSAIYGPLLQVGFALLAALPGGLVWFKLAFVATDLGLAALVARALARRGASPLWLLVYLWHPLPILEVAGQCHLEVVPVALLLLALDLEQTGRPRAAALALGGALAAKYLPVLLLPAFLVAAPRGRARTERLGLVLLPGALCLVPYLGAGADLGRALSAYGQTWRFNDGVFWLLDAALEATGISQAFCRHVLPRFVHVDPWFDPASHQTWMRIPPKLLVGACVLLACGWMARPPAGADRGRHLERAAFVVAALFVALSPTVHPWYALWIIPFLPTRAADGEPTTAAWLLLTLTLPLAYAATVRGGWEELAWVRALEYVPWALLLAWGWARARAASPGSAIVAPGSQRVEEALDPDP